ncbi:MAG: VWA domain-containing protein [Oribacterium sp.]|nr:VWA domain-containing protein [Oribacterium sp.]
MGKEKNYNGERYDKKNDIKRLDAAKVSVCHLIDELFANNTDGKKKVEIGLITFGGKADTPSGKYSDADTLKNVIKNLNSKSGDTVEGGTNWEAALIEANKYNFDDSDPEYVVFVSDGNPTYRVNANGYYDDPKVGEGYRGGGTYDPNGMCLKAAEAAADDLVNHNKQFYAINIFGDAGNMQNLVNNNGSFYRTAADQDAINSTFKDIVKVINGNLSYAEVDITDGITSLTHSALSTQVSGTTSGFTYSVVDKNGNTLEEELKTIKAYPATYVKSDDGTSSVDWHIGGKGKNHKLLEGATYSLSFLVWPDQKVYDDYAIGNSTSKFATNTYAKVNYSKLIEETGKTPKLEEQTPIDLESGEIDLTGADVQVEKVWKMSDIKTQETYIDNKPVELTLFKDGALYKTIEIASSVNDVKDATNNTVTWKGAKITLAPGTLVSVYDAKGKEKHPELKGNKTIKDKANKEYYLLGEGHKYTFTEKSHSDKFELLEKIYHPMLVDGELTNVTFTFSEDGKTIEAIEAMESMVEDSVERLKAYNELKFETLTVSNTYTGNMAVAQETTFDLYLYEKKVDETSRNSELEAYTDDIVSLNFDENKKSGIKLVHQRDGAYRFTIKPDFVDQPKSVSIKLPAGISYQIVEVKDGMPYAEYETKWDDGSKSLLKMLKGNEATNITDVLEVSSVNTINFVNTLNALIPTGFYDNMLPFIAIAFAGISALGFLAFDFRRRRMFED